MFIRLTPLNPVVGQGTPHSTEEHLHFACDIHLKTIYKKRVLLLILKKSKYLTKADMEKNKTAAPHFLRHGYFENVVNTFQKAWQQRNCHWVQMKINYLLSIFRGKRICLSTKASGCEKTGRSWGREASHSHPSSLISRLRLPATSCLRNCVGLRR